MFFSRFFCGFRLLIETQCNQKYIGESTLAAQIKNFLQKDSLSSQNTEKVLVVLDGEQEKA